MHISGREEVFGEFALLTWKTSKSVDENVLRSMHYLSDAAERKYNEKKFI